MWSSGCERCKTYWIKVQFLVFFRIFEEHNQANEMKKLYKTMLTAALAFATFGLVNAQGDSCANAVVITDGVHNADGPATGGGWSGALCDPDSPDPAINSDWYSYTPPTDGLARIYQCIEDTRLNVHTGTCGNLVCYAGNDDDNNPSGSGACGNVCCGSALDFPVTGGTEYFIEWDDRWATGPFTWNLEFHNCVAPTVDFNIVNDCISNEFSIEVDITDLGSALTVDITNTGGAPDISGVGTGVHVVGPFVSGILVDVIVVHDADTFCNVAFGETTNSPCPIVSCGPDNYTYCYGENETTQWVFQSASTDPIALQFNAGAVETFLDGITIYDGDNTTAPILFSGDNGGDLSGIIAISTNPSNSLVLEAFSDGSVSCQSGSQTPEWNWDVACLDCTQPAGSATLVNDCPNFQFFVEIDLTGMGDADTIFIVNDAGVDADTALATGVYTAGPFISGTDVNVWLAHDENPLCNVAFPVFNNGLCPLVTCGPLNETYCYGENETSQWLYQSASTDPIALQFNAGAIESCCDNINVYDGDNTGAPLLFSGNNGGDLSGLLFISTNVDGYLLMQATSDGSVSCQSGSQNPEWNWDVACLDCTQPAGTATLVEDCPNFQYFVEIDLTGLGDADTVFIMNDTGADADTAVTTGVYTVGPFVSGTDANVWLAHNLNPLCNVNYPTFNNGVCPLITCGPLTETYCYGENETTLWLYQSASTDPIALQFLAGGIETCCDVINVYDGDNTGAPLIYTGVNNGDLSGLTFVSNNVDNYLLLELVSDFSVSCQSGSITPEWEWVVSCLDCTQPAASFSLVEDCYHRQFYVDVDVTGLGDAATVDIKNDAGLPPLLGVGLGVHQIGPFVMDQLVEVSVHHDLNPLCNIYSDLLTYSADSCAQLCTEGLNNLCYMNSDTGWMLFESGNGLPITLDFISGVIAAGDQIVIYNGPTTSSALLFNGVNGTNMAGQVFGSSNPEGALLIRITSDDTLSCEDGGVTEELVWEVDCGGVGIAENAALAGVSLFPNPTSGELSLRYTGMEQGEMVLSIFDGLGRTVFNEQLQAYPGMRHDMQLRELSNGVYSIRVDLGGKPYYERLVLQR